jgi:hypothetical protein
MQRYRCQADESRVGGITHASQLGTLRNALVLCCCPDLSAVVQDDEGGRDLRPQPGVLTPGMRQLTNRPDISLAVIHKLTPLRWGGPLRSLMYNCETDIRAADKRSRVSTFRAPVAQRRFYCPFRADHLLIGDLGLKPQAQSLSPFGTMCTQPIAQRQARALCSHSVNDYGRRNQEEQVLREFSVVALN